VQGLVHSINEGEKRPEVYEKYDTDIDGAKEAGTEKVGKIRDQVEGIFAADQKNRQKGRQAAGSGLHLERQHHQQRS
ncbi:hypothetical protein E3A20_16450, partial [Planctomyces bekefii]